MSILSFSTEDVSKEARKTAVERVIASHSDIRVDFSNDLPLSVSFKARVLPGAEILSGTSAAFTCRTVPSDSNFFLLVGQQGVCALEHHDGRRVEVRPGTACLAPVDRPWTTISQETASFVSFALPHALLERTGVDLSSATHVPLSINPALQFLLSYAMALTHGEADESAGEAALYATHIQDLASLVLDAQHGKVRSLAGARGLKFAQIAAIKSDIHANLHDPRLSLTWLAGRHRMSPRAIRDLFYGEGTNFTEYLVGAKLDQAKALLSDPTHAMRTITAIAFDSGFGDLSWFYHTFRRRFGMSPSEMRALTRQTGNQD